MKICTNILTPSLGIVCAVVSGNWYGGRKFSLNGGFCVSPTKPNGGGTTMQKIITWVKAHKIVSVIIGLFILGVIGQAAGGGSTKTTSTSTKAATVTKSSTSTSTVAKKASYEAVLLNPANDNNTPLTLPASGWDANNGWDTYSGWQAQLQQAQNGQNGNAADGSTIILPAVIIKDPKTLELYVNVKNTGNAAGTPVCKIEASSVAGGDPTSGQYFGVNSKTITALNGGDIKPGDYGNVVDDLTITNQGARFIKQVYLTCN